MSCEPLQYNRYGSGYTMELRVSNVQTHTTDDDTHEASKSVTVCSCNYHHVIIIVSKHHSDYSATIRYSTNWTWQHICH